MLLSPSREGRALRAMGGQTVCMYGQSPGTAARHTGSSSHQRRWGLLKVLSFCQNSDSKPQRLFNRLRNCMCLHGVLKDESLSAQSEMITRLRRWSSSCGNSSTFVLCLILILDCTQKFLFYCEFLSLKADTMLSPKE